MATFKATVQKHHKKEDGTYNVKIRVTHKRVNRYIATSKFVTKEELTKGMKLKNQTIIDDLDVTIKKYRDACNALGEKLDAMDVDQVVQYVKGYKGTKEVFTLNFIEFGRGKVEELRKVGREGNARMYEITLNSIERFIDRKFLNINEITVRFLKDYVAWIDASPARPKRGKGERARSLYPSNIRALLNMAKNEYNDEDMGVINIPLSPFAKFKIPKLPPTKKRALPVETIRNIAKTPYSLIMQPGTNRFNLAKDVFMLSFGLIGMNSADLFYCDCIKDGRITYNRTKTKNRREDRAEISIKIEPEILPLIEKYKDPTGERVFKFYQLYKSPDTFNAAINGSDRIDEKGHRHIIGLKKIGYLLGIDDLEFYAARHSWATIATNVAKVDKYVVHTALNHVDEAMKVTDIYIDKDYSLIDEANRKVLDCVKLDIGTVKEEIYKKKERKKPTE